jgi:hypothetical protein
LVSIKRLRGDATRPLYTAARARLSLAAVHPAMLAPMLKPMMPMHSLSTVGQSLNTDRATRAPAMHQPSYVLPRCHALIVIPCMGVARKSLPLPVPKPAQFSTESMRCPAAAWTPIPW